MVLDVKDAATWSAEMTKTKTKLAVVDFYATWCGPCKTVAPMFAQLSAKLEKDATFLKVDVDVLREVAQEAGVKSLPSFGFFFDGKLLELIVGDPRSIESKVKTYADKYNKNPSKSGGYRLGDTTASASSASAAKPAGATGNASAGAGAGAGAGAAPARRNPWADPK